MGFAARFAHGLTVSGFGLLCWVGLGYPSVFGPAALILNGLIAALILSRPLLEAVMGLRGIIPRLRSLFGPVPLVLGAICLGLLVIYVSSIRNLDRNETLGMVLTGLGALILVLHGVHLSKSAWGFQRVIETLLICGYGGVAGALMAGQVQFSIFAISGLALLQLFHWFVFLSEPRALGTNALSVLFAILIPLTMLITLRIGHGLAVPLILSFLIGLAFTLPAKATKSPAPRG